MKPLFLLFKHSKNDDYAFRHRTVYILNFKPHTVYIHASHSIFSGLILYTCRPHVVCRCLHSGITLYAFGIEASYSKHSGLLLCTFSPHVMHAGLVLYAFRPHTLCIQASRCMHSITILYTFMLYACMQTSYSIHSDLMPYTFQLHTVHHIALSLPKTQATLFSSMIHHFDSIRRPVWSTMLNPSSINWPQDNSLARDVSSTKAPTNLMVGGTQIMRSMQQPPMNGMFTFFLRPHYSNDAPLRVTPVLNALHAPESNYSS